MNNDKSLIFKRLTVIPRFSAWPKNQKFPIYLPFSAILCQMLS